MSPLTHVRRRTDVLTVTAARAHRDAESTRSNAEASRRYGHSSRTQYHWSLEGPPPVRDFFAYLVTCTDPIRVAQDGVAAAKQLVIAKLPNGELVERYHDLLDRETAVEAEDRRLDVKRGVSWLDRATAAVRNAAVDSEIAAVEREFETRMVVEDDVFGRQRR